LIQRIIERSANTFWST